MRSIKLLVATAIVAALVAGPVLAQDTGSTMAPAAASTTKATPAKHKHASKKHTAKKPAASTMAPATTAQ